MLAQLMDKSPSKKMRLSKNEKSPSSTTQIWANAPTHAPEFSIGSTPSPFGRSSSTFREFFGGMVDLTCHMNDVLVFINALT